MAAISFHRHTLLSLALICSCFSLQAQTDWPKHLDSLEKVLSTQKIAPDRLLKIYDTLSWRYLYIDFKKAVSWAEKGIALAEKEKDMGMVVRFYRNMGVGYDKIGVSDTAYLYFNKALELAQKTNDEDMVPVLYIAIGNAYSRQESYPQALENYMKALPIIEKQGNKGRYQLLLGNIGGIYLAVKNYDRASFYISEAEKLAREQQDISGLAYMLSKKGVIYIEKEEYAKALSYVLEADSLFCVLHNQYDQAICTQMIVDIYLKGFNNLGKAQEYAEKGISMAKELGASYLTAWNMNSLANVYLKQGKYKECEKTALEALSIDSSRNISLNGDLFKNIILANAGMRNNDKVLYYLDKYEKVVSQVASKEYQSSLSEMQVKYETEKKELKISAMEDERRLMIWLSVAGGVILLLALLTFIIRQRLAVSRRKIAEQQVKQLEQEKQLVATQAVLDGETAERTRLARDLHDGLGGMLSVVKLKLNDVKKGASLEGEDVQRFDQAMSTLEESIGELRRVAHNMMPDSLTRYGLKVSLTDFCNNIPGAEFHYFGDEERLDPKLEIMIYRTVHELVNNALKHAEAGHIIVQIVQESDRMAITVQDDGRGFETSAPTGGTGLNNIRHRVGSYNGRMDLSSTPGKGTEVMIEFKL